MFGCVDKGMACGSEFRPDTGASYSMQYSFLGSFLGILFFFFSNVLYLFNLNILYIIYKKEKDDI